LYSGKHNNDVQLYAFILALDGDDLRGLPLHLRKTDLARLLARGADGIHLAPFEQGEIGPDLSRAACDMMLEGLVSKRLDSRYRPGPSRDWIKVKNPNVPAMNRTKGASSRNETLRRFPAVIMRTRSVSAQPRRYSTPAVPDSTGTP
jgi:bifunctional non-homologous end joining protein LigD